MRHGTARHEVHASACAPLALCSRARSVSPSRLSRARTSFLACRRAESAKRTRDLPRIHRQPLLLLRPVGAAAGVAYVSHHTCLPGLAWPACVRA